jgi:diguanylate cyclase (GGDEF)-like protein
LLLAAVRRDIAIFLRPALRLWLRGNLLQPLGFVLFALRGQIEEWLSVVVANALIAIAFSDYCRGLHRLMQRPEPIALTRAAIVVMVLAIAFFTLVLDRIAVRIVIASLILALLCWSSARVLLQGRWNQLPTAQRVTGGVFVVGMLILLVRAGHPALFPDAVLDGLQSTMVQAVTFATGALLPLVASYGFLLLCNDRMRIELERSAAIDFLTGALNRGATEDQGARTVNRAQRRNTPCAAIVIDVDHFKQINDRFGHAVGDAALREIVGRLRETLRVEDTLGRLGGEEFLVLIDDTSRDGAMHTAERLRAALADRPLQLESGAHPTTISLGVALLCVDDRNFSDLLRRADRALYAAKSAGRNQVRAAPE